MPGCQDFSFALGSYSSFQLLTLGWLRFEPGERIARSYIQGTKCQTLAQCALNIDPAHAAFAVALVRLRYGRAHKLIDNWHNKKMGGEGFEPPTYWV